MRYIKPHYYDAFTCLADQCPETCCAGWQIMIDEDSLEKYENIPGPFGNRIRNSIDWEEGCFFQYGKRCAFLNEEDLCDLQTELGEDSLCDTCRMYPRHVEEYEDLREYSLSLSCPEAARMILGCKEKVTFETWETEEEDDFEEFDFLMFTQLEDAREVIYQILQNRTLDLRVRMKSMLELSDQIQTCVEENRFYDVDRIIERCKEKPEGTRKTNLQDRYAFMHAGLEILEKMEHLKPGWETMLKNIKETLFANGIKTYEAIYEGFQKEMGYDSSGKEDWEIEGEQLLLFFVYTYFCGSVYDDQVLTKMQLCVFSVLWIQELWMYHWAEEKRKPTFLERTELAWTYAREIEHSDPNLELLEEWFLQGTHG